MSDEIEFFSRQDQGSLDTMDDIFGEKDGVVFIIQNRETKLYLAANAAPEEVTYFIQEYTDDRKKAMSFKTRGSAIAYYISENILFTHDVIDYCE